MYPVRDQAEPKVFLQRMMTHLGNGCPGNIEKSRSAKCISNMRQLGTALLTYAGENNGKFPPLPTPEVIASKDTTKGWQGLIADYVGYSEKTGAPPVFTCPSGTYDRKIAAYGQWRGYALNEFVQDEYYQNNTVFGNGALDQKVGP
jgi:hypothetical protein